MSLSFKNVLHTKEKKIQCPICNMMNCLEEQVDTITTWLCIECGYNSNTTYKTHSNELKKVLSTSPQLVIDLKKFDKERKIWWFPTILNMPTRGIIYPEGNTENWVWVYSPIVDIPESDKHLYPIPGKENQFYEKRLAVEKSKTFKKNDFFSALKAIGAIIKCDMKDSKIDKEVDKFAKKAIKKEQKNSKKKAIKKEQKNSKKKAIKGKQKDGNA